MTAASAGAAYLNQRRDDKRRERFKARIDVLMREGLSHEDARFIAHFLERTVAEFHRRRGGQTTG